MYFFRFHTWSCAWFLKCTLFTCLLNDPPIQYVLLGAVQLRRVQLGAILDCIFVTSGINNWLDYARNRYYCYRRYYNVWYISGVLLLPDCIYDILRNFVLTPKLTVLMQILASYLVSLTYHKVNINTFIKSMFVYEIATLPRTASLSFGLACRDSSRQICSQIINVYAQALPSSTWLPAYGWYGDAVGVH